MASKALVTGEIAFDKPASFDDATIRIKLENTGMMDAPAGVVAEQVMRDVEYEGRGTIAFELHGNMPTDSRARLNVRVHVSMNGDDDIHKGDYISMQTYPVLTHNNPNHVKVTVKRV